jgi:hypothetical protein
MPTRLYYKYSARYGIDVLKPNADIYSLAVEINRRHPIFLFLS